MRFFNLDVHISVIADIKWILERLGHHVTNWSVSGHEWVFGKQTDQVDIVNQDTWKRIDQPMCDAFYDRYQRELAGYDGFIVTHTPCFAMLYERWHKPVVVVASTRYEYPFTGEARKWEAFNHFLRKQIDGGAIVPLANNKYDAAYAEYFTQRRWDVIPSLCAYTNMRYVGSKRDYLYWSRFKGAPLPPGVIDKDRAFRAGYFSRARQKIRRGSSKRGYAWSELADYRGVVHIPYNASVMSIFEQYTANIPLFFPSFQYLSYLHERHLHEGVLSQLSYNQVDGIPPGSVIPTNGRDPNNYVSSRVMSDWIALADFYDEANMPYVTYFDAFGDLEEVCRSADLEGISHLMEAFNAERRERIFESWTNVLRRLP